MNELSAPSNLNCKIRSLLSFGLRSYFITPQGYTRLILVHGCCVRRADAGLNFLRNSFTAPEAWGALVCTKQQVREYIKERVYTKNGVKCEADIIVYFRVIDPETAVYQVDDYETALANFIRASLRDAVGQLTSQELLSGRERLKSSLKTALEPVVPMWGVEVELVEIREIETQQ